MSSQFIEFPFIPITEDTFKRQGWERVTEVEYEEDDMEGDAEGDTFSYWVLPLPKDNPDDACPFLISSADDEYRELGIKKGEYFVEIADFFGLGMCANEEELEILYRSLTNTDIE